MSEYHWYIAALSGLGILACILICLGRTISRLKKRYSERRRGGRGGHGASIQSNARDDSSAGGFSDLEELANLEEQLEIEQFLAEIRSSEVQSSSISLSTDARKEFIANVLISQRVSIVEDDGNANLEENNKGSELFLCRQSPEQNPKDDGFEKSGARPQCAICLLEYENGEAIVWSHNKRCNHHFHKACMIEWLKSNNECPLCRNNYLALSDDEQTDVDGISSLPGDPSYFSQVTHVVSSVLNSDPTVETELPSVQLDSLVFRVSDLEDCIAHDNVSAVTSSSDESIYTAHDPWGGELDGESTASPAAISDAWSCPSANDLQDPSPNLEDAELAHRPRNRQKNRRRQSEEESQPAVQASYNQDVSLELDDLIVDGLMRRLEKRGVCREVPLGVESDSCTSIYTRGTDEDLI